MARVVFERIEPNKIVSSNGLSITVAYDGPDRVAVVAKLVGTLNANWNSQMNIEGSDPQLGSYIEPDGLNRSGSKSFLGDME